MKRKRLSFFLLSVVAACGTPGSSQPQDASPDARTSDASSTDSSSIDASSADASSTDSSLSEVGAEASSPEAGAPDAALPEASAPDAAAQGRRCSSGSACASGNCVDGVCCESACNGGCMACNNERTGQADGTCAPVTAATDPDNECGTDGCQTGACNGAGACAVQSAGFVCRPPAGPCDVAETCDGSNALCPRDAFAAASQSCRPAAGPCDVEERCSGAAAACPADVFLPPSTPALCAPYRCSGAGGACPTSCTADADCQTGTLCIANSCTRGLRTFVTSGTFNGLLGGVPGADARCAMAAAAAGLTGDFRAMLRHVGVAFGMSWAAAPTGWVYYRQTGTTRTVVATSTAQLTGSGNLLAAINSTELGVAATAFDVWTGNGSTNIDSCLSWSSSSAGNSGIVGDASALDSMRLGNIHGTCASTHRLYCVEQPPAS